MMRSAVLGGSGFIGSAVIDELVRNGHDVLAVDRAPKMGQCDGPQVTRVQADILDSDSLRRVFEGVDEVYHFAADLGTTELDTALRRTIDVNVIGSLNVFESALAAGVPRVLFASKAHVWLNAYTVTKHTAEQLGRLFSQLHPIRISSLRYFNMFGPKQKVYPVRKVLPTFAIQAMRGLPLQVFGNGEQTVDMLYVEDAAKMTVDYLQRSVTARPVDCGTGMAMTVNDVAVAVNDYFNNPGGIQHMPMRRGEVPDTTLRADTGNLEEVIGPLQLTDFDLALKKSLAWYEQLDTQVIDAALTYHGLHQPFDTAWS